MGTNEDLYLLMSKLYFDWLSLSHDSQMNVTQCGEITVSIGFTCDCINDYIEQDYIKLDNIWTLITILFRMYIYMYVYLYV